MEDFYYAGGLPAVLEQIRDLLHLDALTVTGRTVGENLDAVPTEIIDEARDPARAPNPLDAGGSLVVLRGNLCPDGAVMKISAADPRLLAHEGRGDRLRGHPRPRRARRRPRPRRRRRLGDGAAQRGPGRRARDARVGPPADPGEAPQAGRLRPAADLRRADERHLVRRRRPPRRARVGGRRAARARPDRRPDPARRRRPARSTCWSTTPSSRGAAPRGRRRRARTSAATGSLYEDHVLQANEGCDLDFLRGRSPVVTDAVTHI